MLLPIDLIKKDYAEAYSNRGISLKELGKHEEAVSSYKKAIKIKPDFADAYLNLGSVLTDEGEVENAIFNASKEINQRYDFKGSNCEISFDKI